MQKRITGLLLALLLALTLLPVTASTSNPISSFSLTHNPIESINFILGDRQVTVANLPDTEAFRSVWVRIVDESGRTQTEDVMSRRSDGSVSMQLSRLANGYYYVELYAHAGGTAYRSYISGDLLKFHWSDGSGVFMESPALERNKKIYQAGRSDNSALAYYLTPTKYIQSDNADIVKLAHDITSGIADDYYKALAIHDWICENLWYDWDVVETEKQDITDAVSTLRNRLAVCGGFSNLTAALLQAVGIPAKNVFGHGRVAGTLGGWTQEQLSGNEMNHVWNEAYINGRWVIIDTTWNCGNEYRGGMKTESRGLRGYRFFDATIEAFSLSHLIDPYVIDLHLLHPSIADSPTTQMFLLESEIPLSDSPSPWAATPVSTAISTGLVPRIMRVKYTQATTRAEFCALATALYENVTGEEITGRVKFNDTSDVNVEKMAYLGVVNGIGNNMFAPNEPLNREQAATMLSRLAVAIGKPIPNVPSTFSDNDNVSPWAADAVGQMQSTGIMSGVGDNMFSPKSRYTREQSIVTILRMYEAVNIQQAA